MFVIGQLHVVVLCVGCCFVASLMGFILVVLFIVTMFGLVLVLLVLWVS